MKVLESAYFNVQTIAPSQSVLRAARDGVPDAILLPLMLVGMDVFACCRTLKLFPQTAGIPLVVLTGATRPPERLRALQAGASDCLCWPDDELLIPARLQALIREKHCMDEWASLDAIKLLDNAGPRRNGKELGSVPVLVVAERPAEASLVAASLRGAGMDAATAGSPAEAEHRLREEPWDLVVLSLQLSQGDPLRFAARLRAGSRTRNIPLLVLSDAGQKAVAAQAFDIGAGDWQELPADPAELGLRASGLVHRKRHLDDLRLTLQDAMTLAVTDPLTGLYNRRYGLARLRQLLTLYSERLAVLIIDIDRFKSINDSMGHAAGDEALRTIAEILRANARVDDIVARMGGEEFLAILPGIELDEAETIAHRLRLAVAEGCTQQAGGIPPGLTVSIGVAGNVDAGVGSEPLLLAADAALYRAKCSGRDRVCVADRVELPV
jgi:two-component system cell cycle response regulator